MITISILTLIVAKALPALNTHFSSIHFTRITSIVFLFSGALSLNSLNLDALGSGIGLYSGLFQVTSISQTIEIFIFLIGFSRGAAVSPAGSVGPGRCPLGTRTPWTPTLDSLLWGRRLPQVGGYQRGSLRAGGTRPATGLACQRVSFIKPTPLPPPVRIESSNPILFCTGGGILFYSLIPKGGSRPPLITPQMVETSSI